MRIRPCQPSDQSAWADLRRALWPECPDEEHAKETAEQLDQPDRFQAFLALDERGQALGFVEVSIRSDHVNGTEHSPAGFVEGLYVRPEARRRGIARQLVSVAAHWARTRGCRELASDVLLENRQSQALHGAIGFEETERVVYYRMTLLPVDNPPETSLEGDQGEGPP